MLKYQARVSNEDTTKRLIYRVVVKYVSTMFLDLTTVVCTLYMVSLVKAATSLVPIYLTHIEAQHITSLILLGIKVLIALLLDASGAKNVRSSCP